MHSQLRFGFDDEVCTTDGADGQVIEYNNIHVRESTFIGGLAAKVHRWFRLTPSFGPDLVQEMLREMETPKSAVLLDPFAGAGTTLIEGKLEGEIFMADNLMTKCASRYEAEIIDPQAGPHEEI